MLHVALNIMKNRGCAPKSQLVIAALCWTLARPNSELSDRKVPKADLEPLTIGSADAHLAVVRIQMWSGCYKRTGEASLLAPNRKQCGRPDTMRCVSSFRGCLGAPEHAIVRDPLISGASLSRPILQQRRTSRLSNEAKRIQPRRSIGMTIRTPEQIAQRIMELLNQRHPQARRVRHVRCL